MLGLGIRISEDERQSSTPPSQQFLLLEDGTNLLLEDGTQFLLE